MVLWCMEGWLVMDEFLLWMGQLYRVKGSWTGLSRYMIVSDDYLTIDLTLVPQLCVFHAINLHYSTYGLHSTDLLRPLIFPWRVSAYLKTFLITIFLYVKFLYWQFLITSLIFFLPTPYLFLPPWFFLGIWFSLISIVIICIYCSVLSSCNPPRKTLIVYVFCVQCFRLSLFSFCFFFLYYFMTHIC